MYCSSCGSAIPPGLKFCNRCGVDLLPKDAEIDKRKGPSPDSLVWAIVGVTSVGLCAVVAFMVIMKEVVHLDNTLITGFTAATLLSTLLIDVLFAGFLLRSKKQSPDQATDLVQLKAAIRAELYAAQTAGLVEPISSVTDHTTRTLEPVTRSQKSAEQRNQRDLI